MPSAPGSGKMTYAKGVGMRLCHLWTFAVASCRQM